MTYAAQDINGMKRLNDKIVGSIIGNTNTKVIMRIEDPETAKMAIELAGKAYGPTVDGHVYDAGTPAADAMSFRDLKTQENGDMHVIHGDSIVRVQGLYVNAESTFKGKNPRPRANHFAYLKPIADHDTETAR